MFSCPASFNCQFSANSVSVGTGADTLTLTYSPLPITTFDYTVTNPLFISMGMFTVTTTGTGVTFSDQPTPHNRILFTLTFHQTLPQVASGQVRALFYNGDLHFGEVAISATASVLPGDATYPIIVYQMLGGGVVGEVAAVPEPSTLILVGTVTIAALGRARKARLV
jgi:hypothetical protein